MSVRSRILMGLLLLSALTVGCGRKAREVDTGVEYVYGDGHISGVVAEGIIIDADYEIPEEQYCKPVQVCFKEASFASVEEILLPDIVSQEDYILFKKDGMYEEGKVRGFTSDGRFLSVYEPTYQIYYGHYLPDRESQDVYVSKFNLVSLFPDASTDVNKGLFSWPEMMDWPQDGELVGLSRQKAVESVRQILREELGVPIAEQPYVFTAFTLELIQEAVTLVEKQYPEAREWQFSENDEFYYMLFNLEVNGLPLSSGNYWWNNFSHAFRSGYEGGNTVLVVFGRQGIEWIETFGNQYQVLSTGEVKPILTMEEALSHVTDYYENTIILEGETRNIKRICYRYTPVLIKTGELSDCLLELVPVWIMETTWQDQKTGHTYWDVIYINAFSGEILWPTDYL